MLDSNKSLTIIGLFTILLLALTTAAVLWIPHFTGKPLEISGIAEQISNNVIPQLEPDYSGIQPQEIVIDYNIPILMYHYVEYNDNPDDFLRDTINTPPHIFEAQVETLKSAGYKFITPSQLVAIVNKGDIDTNKYVILSFDDGYRDFYTDAFPIIQKYEARAVQYVVAGFINQPNYMYDSQIREIVKSGLVEIGSHSMRHSNYKDLSPEQIAQDLINSKKILEDKFLIKIVSFAYPYGGLTSDTPQLVKDAGYTNAVTVIPGAKVNKNTLYTLRRIRPGQYTGQNLINLLENRYLEDQK